MNTLRNENLNFLRKFKFVKSREQANLNLLSQRFKHLRQENNRLKANYCFNITQRFQIDIDIDIFIQKQISYSENLNDDGLYKMVKFLTKEPETKKEYEQEILMLDNQNRILAFNK